MIEEMKLGFQVLQFLLTGGCCIYVYLSNKDKVTNDRITSIQKGITAKTDEHGERISKLEGAALNSPNHDDLEKIHDKINLVAGALQELKGEFNGASKTLNLIHETLMERGK